MRTPDLIRSTPFRLSLALALAIVLATASVFALVYLELSTSDVARLRVVLVGEAAIGVGENEDQLRRALELRLTRDLRRLDYVALFDKDGRLAFGNITKLPEIPVDGEAHFVAGARQTDAEGTDEPALFVASRRADGGVLLLGRSLIEVYAIRDIVLRALLTGLVPTTLLSLAIGAFFAWRASLRLALVHETIEKIMRGDLDARLPVGGADDDIGKVTRAVNLMLDELVRLLNQLKSAGDNIAHDLRTPLAVMRAKLERGLAQDSTNEDLRLAAVDSLGQLDRAMATVTALMRISAIENGLRASAFREIDLASICVDLFDFYEPLARSKSIEMSFDAPAAAPMRGDAELMREAIANLIDNAIKFTPSGGTVRLEVDKGPGPPIVRVTDSGPGVAPGDRDKIFRRFYRGANEKETAGQGIGLSIAKTIAGLHGLELTVEDSRFGASFRLAKAGLAATA